MDGFHLGSIDDFMKVGEIFYWAESILDNEIFMIRSSNLDDSLIELDVDMIELYNLIVVIENLIGISNTVE
jgi:hypothetical protein